MEQTEYGETVVVRRRVGEPAGRMEEPVQHKHGYMEEPERTAAVAVREWPVRWSAVWVGALIALTAAAILGLAASAIGDAEASSHLTSWGAFSRGALIYSIFTSLLAFFLGGFFAARVAGIRGLEPALLHGALTWLVVFPALLLLGAIGAGHFFGNFATGLIGPAAWVAPAAGSAAVDPVAATATKNVAISALFAILMGLIGGLIGGWLASDLPFDFGRRTAGANHTTAESEDRAERRYRR